MGLERPTGCKELREAAVDVQRSLSRMPDSALVERLSPRKEPSYCSREIDL